MINIILTIALLCSLVIFIYQDFKHRGIELILLLVVLVVTVIYNFRMGWGWIDPMLSMVYLLGLYALLTLMFSVKEGKLVNVFNKYLGIGDVLFLISIIPLFSFRNFMFFCVSGAILSIIVTLLIWKFNKRRKIPLAGILSAYLVLWVTYSVVTLNPSFLRMDII